MDAYVHLFSSPLLAFRQKKKVLGTSSVSIRLGTSLSYIPQVPKCYIVVHLELDVGISTSW